MKKVIYLCEKETTILDKHYLCRTAIVKESLLESILSDAFTYFIMLLSFGINQYFIHSRMVSFVMLIMFIVFLTAQGTHKRVSSEEYKKIVDELLEE